MHSNKLLMTDLNKYPKGTDIVEYSPKDVSLDWLSKEAYNDPQVLVSATQGGPAEINVREWGPVRRVFMINSKHEAMLRVRTFYFPGWHASVDGVDTPLSAEPVTGAILLKVPAGIHNVGIVFSDTPVRKAGKLFSAAAGGLLLYIYFRSRRNKAVTV